MERRPVRILRPCIDCGRPTAGSRCPKHAAERERERQARQPYRRAYESSIYRENRRIRLKRAGNRCERIVDDGRRCPNAASETHHVIPLSAAKSYEEALALCDWRNLRAVCWRHNPRGQR